MLKKLRVNIEDTKSVNWRLWTCPASDGSIYHGPKPSPSVMPRRDHHMDVCISPMFCSGSSPELTFRSLPYWPVWREDNNLPQDPSGNGSPWNSSQRHEDVCGRCSYVLIGPAGPPTDPPMMPRWGLPRLWGWHSSMLDWLGRFVCLWPVAPARSAGYVKWRRRHLVMYRSWAQDRASGDEAESHHWISNIKWKETMK